MRDFAVVGVVLGIVLGGLGGCGGPMLQNVPAPNPAVVAGAAAAIAGAATLADPAAAAKRQEENKPTTEKRPQHVDRNVPADVLDRLDDAQASGSGSADGRGR
ncbi:MAG: hypothetical protein NT062_37030 [Proteobacteria bacterium]|nr:hypothetical protein [Pseudomonadota bacterium]